jgi:hypothetical protein
MAANLIRFADSSASVAHSLRTNPSASRRGRVVASALREFYDVQKKEVIVDDYFQTLDRSRRLERTSEMLVRSSLHFRRAADLSSREILPDTSQQICYFDFQLGNKAPDINCPTLDVAF